MKRSPRLCLRKQRYSTSTMNRVLNFLLLSIVTNCLLQRRSLRGSTNLTPAFWTHLTGVLPINAIWTRLKGKVKAGAWSPPHCHICRLKQKACFVQGKILWRPTASNVSSYLSAVLKVHLLTDRDLSRIEKIPPSLRKCASNCVTSLYRGVFLTN